MKLSILLILLLSTQSLYANSSVLKLSNYELGEKILNRYIRLQSEGKIKWDYNWTNGVALFGTNKFLWASQRHSNREYRQRNEAYVKRFQAVMDLQVTRGLPEVTAPDLVAMSLGALSFMDVVVDCESCDRVIDNTITYFETEPLNWVGAYDHVGKRYRIRELPFPPRRILGSCIFIDSAMAYIPEGVRISLIRSDDKSLEFFLDQYEIFHKHLFEKATGLYKQAYYPYLERKDPQNYTWSRGNMYMALGLLDTLEVLPKNHERFKVLRNRMNRLLENVAKYADLDNGLRTLTNSPSRDNYFESSSSAFLVANILKANRLGLLDDRSLVEKAKKLAKSLKKYLKLESQAEISINQVSGATTAFYPDWYYLYVIRPSKDKTTGIGAYMLMLSELVITER